MIFDSHAHYDDHQYDEDRDELINMLYANGIGRIVDVSADINGIKNVIALAEKYPFIYATSGIHPDTVDELKPSDIDYIEKMGLHEKVVAIGEIGLDYFEREGDAPKDREKQKYWFDAQIEVARKIRKPFIIHSRDACEDTLDILKKYNSLNAVMHCYSYTKETAKTLLDMGIIFGIGGVITFKNAKKLKEAVEYIPIESIILETDCPYLAPDPFRGKRNESDYIRYVIDAVADIKGLSPEYVEETCWNNANRFYGLD